MQAKEVLVRPQSLGPGCVRQGRCRDGTEQPAHSTFWRHGCRPFLGHDWEGGQRSKQLSHYHLPTTLPEILPGRVETCRLQCWPALRQWRWAGWAVRGELLWRVWCRSCRGSLSVARSNLVFLSNARQRSRFEGFPKAQEPKSTAEEWRKRVVKLRKPDVTVCGCFWICKGDLVSGLQSKKCIDDVDEVDSSSGGYHERQPIASAHSRGMMLRRFKGAKGFSVILGQVQITLLSPPRSILWQKAWHSSKYFSYLLFFTTTTSTSYSDAWYRRQQDLSIHRCTPHCLQAVQTCRGRVVSLALPETSLKTCLVEAFFLSPWIHSLLCFLL